MMSPFFAVTQRLSKQRWQLLNLAPAHVAAFQRLGIGRVGDGQFAEVSTAFALADQLFRQRFLIVNLLLSRVFRQWQQDVAEV